MLGILEEIAYMHNKALQMRRLSAEHGAAGHDSISAKLAEVAQELEQKAARLERQVAQPTC